MLTPCASIELPLSSISPTSGRSRVGTQKIRLQSDPTTTAKGSSFALGRRVVRKHIDELTDLSKSMESSSEEASRTLQQAKEHKQQLKKEEARLESALQVVNDTKTRLSKSIDDQAPIFTDSLAVSILNANGKVVQSLLENRDNGLKLEQEIWQLKQKLVASGQQVSVLTEEKKTLKGQLSKLTSEIETAKLLMNQLQELVPQKCVVCLDKSATHAIVPCGHRALCASCGKKISSRQIMSSVPKNN